MCAESRLDKMATGGCLAANILMGRVACSRGDKVLFSSLAALDPCRIRIQSFADPDLGVLLAFLTNNTYICFFKN
jgi:hypothetical protein